VLVTPSFARVTKKLHTKDKQALDETIKALRANPALGEEKKGDLLGIFVYKFKLNNQETLLAYSLRPDRHTPADIVLHAIGPHENFYTQLKR